MALAAMADPDDRGSEVSERAEAVPTRHLVRALQGVPKAALRSVLGKELGSRSWRQVHGRADQGSEPAVTDDEIVEGLLEHLSRQAAGALRREGREARSVSLYVTYADGAVRGERRRLSRLTRQAGELLAGSLLVYQSMPARKAAVVGLELRLTSVAAEPSAERASGAWEMAAFGRA